MADRKWNKRYVKKPLSVFFSIMLCCLSLNMGQAAAADIGQNESAAGGTVKSEQSNDAKSIWEQWKNTAVQAPGLGELVPAGPVKVQWEALEGLPWKTVSYRVYLDDVLVKEIEAEEAKAVFSCEVYTTKTASHQVKIEAVLENEEIVTASIRTFFVSKKGLGIPREAIVMAQDMNGSWYYNWSPEPDSRVKEELDFVPMIWNDNADGAAWLANEENQEYGTVLGYNEPDRSDQANLSAQTAADNQQLFTASGLRVGAPAVSSPPSWGNQWFLEYVEKADMDAIDFIPFHCYLDWADGTAKSVLEAVDQTYQMYQKPIWITEFAIAKWDYPFFNGQDEQKNEEVRQFMQEVVEGLEARDYVERYAWQQFDVGDSAGGSSALYNQDTGELTALGLIYRGIGNPEGYVLPELDGIENAQTVSDIYVEETWQGPDDGDNTEPGTDKPGNGDNTEPGTDKPGNGDNTEPGTDKPGNGDNTKPGTDKPGNGDNTDPGTDKPDNGDNTKPGTDKPDNGDNTKPGTDKPDNGDNTKPGTDKPGNSGNGEDGKVPDNGNTAGDGSSDNGSVPDNGNAAGGNASSNGSGTSGSASAPKTGDSTVWLFPAAGLFLSVLVLGTCKKKRN